MIRRTTALLCALGLLILLTACGSNAPVSSDLPDVSNESSEFTPDSTTTTVPPTTTTTTTAAPTTTTTAPLTAEQKQELQIKKDFLAWSQSDGYNSDRTIDEVAIYKSYGSWNGALALSIGFGGAGSLGVRYHNILGNKYTGGYLLDTLHLYKSGKFKTLDAAYNSGWVTEEEVGKILKLVINTYDRQVLDNRVIHQTIAFLKEQYPDGSDLFGDVASLTVMDVDVSEMQKGQYDGFAVYAVSVTTYYSAPGFGSGEFLTDMQLAGYTFTIPREGWAVLFIYKDGQVKHLPQAYEAGWLDKDEVHSILKQMRATFK